MNGAKVEQAKKPPRTLRDLVLAYERIVIIEALAKCGGSRTRAAQVLGVGRQYLYRRVRATGIDLGQIAVRMVRPGAPSRG